MMEDYWYRAKAITEKLAGQWVYGWYVGKTNVAPPSIITKIDGVFTSVPVDLETVGRYVGIKDKNNEKIYHQDIVRNDYYNGHCYLRIKKFHLRTIAEFLPELSHEYVIGLKTWGYMGYYEIYSLKNADLKVVGTDYEELIQEGL